VLARIDYPDPAGDRTVGVEAPTERDLLREASVIWPG
jgi:hypothetical protein